MNEIKKAALHTIDAHANTFTAISDAIWDEPELSLKEFKAAALYTDALEKLGFTVQKNLCGIETAFSGSYGSGHPVIGILGEFDALSGLSQQSGVAEAQSVTPGGNGHGCGHNLLGAGSAAAGIALAQLVDEGLPATVVVYGTPAEETLAGKTIMIENGYFRDVDVCLAWHPLDHNDPGEVKFKAAEALTFTFHGRAAHACNCPENGRSALDAAELTNIGVNYLREHVDKDCYMHYCYTHGGERPNIVPDYAQLWYMVRAYTFAQMKELEARVRRVAEGACLMTDTTVEVKILGENHDSKLNFTLAALAHDCMEAIGAPRFTEEEKAYARQVAQAVGLPGVEGELDESILPVDGTIKKDNGSSDVADVSQIVPVVNINTACYGRKTPNHSWAVTVQADKPAAHRGMLFAAKTLALMGTRLATEPTLLAAVRAEFEQAE